MSFPYQEGLISVSYFMSLSHPSSNMIISIFGDIVLNKVGLPLCLTIEFRKLWSCSVVTRVNKPSFLNYLQIIISVLYKFVFLGYFSDELTSCSIYMGADIPK